MRMQYRLRNTNPGFSKQSIISLKKLNEVKDNIESIAAQYD